MSADTATSLEQAVESVLDRERICEQSNVQCSSVADWWHIVGCCSSVTAKCSLHKYGTWDDGTPSPAPQPGERWRCGRCGTVDDASSDRWEPIR